jgi:hypothetical protein
MKIAASILSCTIAMLFVGLVSGARADDKPASNGKQGAGYPDLVAGLKKTPGCLGVELARTISGKQVIFAWFENRKAVLNWYRSEMHQQVMNDFFPSYVPRKPLKDVPDDGPIMAIASITFGGKPRFKESTLPISQIAIELYKPITGGIFLGSRFAPESLKVPNMIDASKAYGKQKVEGGKK